jgi:YfiH family protein
VITVGAINDIAGVRHGFFTRSGGVSQGVYSSLNCGFGSKDDAECVASNRARAMGQMGLPGDALLTTYQVHSNLVAVVEEPWQMADRPKVDAMVTKRPGIALGILAADCAPVLFVDPEAGVLGVAHAGWRGAFGGVLAAAVETMRELGAEPADTIAAVGPCIAQRSYEVGQEFPGPFLEQESNNADFFAPAPREGHFLFDLPGYVTRRLGALGLGKITSLSVDSFSESDRFFSYRRACKRGEPDYGRGLSAIAIVN